MSMMTSVSFLMILLSLRKKSEKQIFIDGKN